MIIRREDWIWPQREKFPAPPPGTGTVFVIGSRGGDWQASWQSKEGEPAAVTSLVDVTREEAIAWAREQPAATRLICEPGSNEYEPFG